MARRLVCRIIQITVIVVLPFFVLARTGTWLYQSRGVPTWGALLGAAAVTLGVLTWYPHLVRRVGLTLVDRKTTDPARGNPDRASVGRRILWIHTGVSRERERQERCGAGVLHEPPPTLSCCTRDAPPGRPRPGRDGCSPNPGRLPPNGAPRQGSIPPLPSGGRIRSRGRPANDRETRVAYGTPHALFPCPGFSYTPPRRDGRAPPRIPTASLTRRRRSDAMRESRG